MAGSVPVSARATSSAPLVVSWIAIATGAATLAGLWLLDSFVFRTAWLTTFQGRPALTPLYAFAMPVVRWQAIGFVLAGAVLTVLADRLTDPERTHPGSFALFLFAASLTLPLTLFVVRQGPLELGSAFLVYPREEVYADAARITALRPFLAHYVELGPQLSLHGQVYPPGYAVLLYGVRRLLGTSVLAAGAVVLVCFAAGVLVAWLALRTLATERAARQGALLLLACPSLLDFACTAMDAVFFSVAMLAWWSGLRAAMNQRPGDGALAGLSLLLATCVSFSAIPLGLVVGLYVCGRGWKAPGRAIAVLACIGGAYVAAALMLWATTGFSVLRCLSAAKARSVTIMTAIVGRDPATLYGHISYGNLAAYAIGAGVALVTAAAVRQLHRGMRPDAWTGAAAITLLVMGLGGLYMMETERIWMFAMPWLAAIAIGDGPLAPPSFRTLLGTGLAQALAMEMALFTIW
jgi:hypothetical protein